jgi:hypothetical protein
MEPIFGNVSTGQPGARVGDTFYVLLPARSGGLEIRSDWPARGDLASFDPKGSSHHSFVADETTFRAEMADIAENARQRAELGRYEDCKGVRTPWGKADSSTVYADGLISHGTSGHGGFKVFAKLNRQIPEPYRNEDGWYEEDAEWAKIAVSLPGLFTDREVRQATATVKRTFPYEYEAVTGETLAPGESARKDQDAFDREHAADWVVISAIKSSTYEGMTETYATLGGQRGGWKDGVETTVEDKRFLVPSEEYSANYYRNGVLGFVIDPARHEEFDPAAAPRP